MVKSLTNNTLGSFFKIIIFLTVAFFMRDLSVFSQVIVQPSKTPGPNFIHRSNPSQTPTTKLIHGKYPPPKWEKWKRGKNYVANIISVHLAKDISPGDKKNALEKMNSVGKLTLRKFKYLKLTYYYIEINNGMTEKQAVDFLNSVPGIELAYPKIISIKHAN